VGGASFEEHATTIGALMMRARHRMGISG
jgi:hypothetical protein